MTRPVIVTGCGRSGTHWVGNIMERVFGPDGAFEPDSHRKIKTVVVDSRLRHNVRNMEAAGHKIVHLVRDGRDVVRSLDKWHWLTGPSGPVDFTKCCDEWSDAIDVMDGYEIMRVEDLSTPETRDASDGHRFPHWTEWDEGLMDIFWNICGEQMTRMGYER